ncbi:major facilitator superfamily domain-containing protein [Boeremia exigua]|uniref:major facilitator superfamily domain-containing protein n=1 Tax=Boeremia exigua TaxID=749465 RepID=UPI001E8D5BA7|nr:major facilitator superfamily domain-containing protein [Boeremia exigua]KAH6629328.1 major facilitator superfamily domain-containing protein [Boeremia exigua]
MASLQDPYPEVELAAPPLARPLHEPSPLLSRRSDTQDADDVSESSSYRTSHSRSGSKRESFNMSGSTFLVTSSGTTLRLPIPSDSKSDPLNWTPWKRAGAMFALAWFFVMSSTAVQAPSVFLPGIAVEFGQQDVRPWAMESIITAPTLFIGIGALLWVPLSLAMGRRPVFLIVALMQPLATLGAGLSPNFHTLFACACIIGLGQGFSVTAAFLMVVDLTFIHQRTRAVASIWSVLAGAGTGFLAIVPYLSPPGTWRPFYYYWSIPMALSFPLALLLYPETYFKRPTVAFDGLILLQSATEKLTIYKDLDIGSDIYRDLPDLPSDYSQERTLFRRFCSYFQFRCSPVTSWKSMGYCYIQMAHCAINPLIFWVLLASAIHWASILFVGSTYTNILRSPPYTLRPSIIININISSAVGAFLAYPVGGWLIDRVLKRMAQRNGGVREAEHFLIGYIPPALIGACGSVLYGFAVHRQWHYSLFFVSTGLTAFAWITLCITNIMWLTEAFPRWAAPAVAVSGGACYIISFAIGFGLLPWISAHGFKLVGIELAFLQLAAGLVAVPVAFWGKGARQAINGRWSEERSGALRPL